MNLVVITSFLLSILATILFFGKKLGISVLIFTIAFLFFTIFLLERRKKVKNRKAYFIAIIILLLSSTYAIYRNTFFEVINIAVIFILYYIFLMFATTSKEEQEYIFQKIVAWITKPFSYIKKACYIFGKVFKTKSESEKQLPYNFHVVKQILIGLGISIPLLIVIISLLASADFIFAEQVGSVVQTILKPFQSILKLDFWFSTFGRILCITILGFYFLAIFIYTLVRKPKVKTENKINISVESTICNTVVTLLNIIYFIFCYLQITNLIAKMGNVEQIDYANYARQGFFQLMAVSIINFAIILITTQNTKKGSKFQTYYTKIMNFILAICTMIILFSAYIRMNLYGQAYGFTYLRIFVYFALITEALLMLPTLIYIFYEKFLPWKTYFVIITIIYVIMNFSNISKIIAQKNINHYQSRVGELKRDIDLDYLQKTKTDGLEEVINFYKTADDEYIKYELYKYFYSLKAELEKQDDWMEWNYSKWNARNLLQEVLGE